MKNSDGTIIFEILIDESFAVLNTDATLSPAKNKRVLSFINDFEEGAWRYQKFQNFIWDNIVQTALSYKERISLTDQFQTSLIAAAKNLRLVDKESADVGEGSELAEIMLYGVMKHHFKALPVVPKIYYKQNSQDFVKGADSVHIVIENNDDFSLWFGEAKFYNSIEDVRLDKVVKSVKSSLEKDKLKRENGIITSVSDLDLLIENPVLREKVKTALSPRESIDDIKPKLNIIILLIHECEITQSHKLLTDDYKQQIRTYHKERAQAYFKKQIKQLNKLHLYSEIRFHIALIPVPVKKLVTEKFVSTAEFFKKQG